MTTDIDEVLLQRMIRDYTEIKPVVVEGEPDSQNVFLVVEQQSFCVTPHMTENMEHAKFYQKMLGIALSKIALATLEE